MPPRTEVSSAVRSGSPNASSSITASIAVEQRLAAALDAVGLDRGEAEDAVERAGRGRAELLRHHDAPLGVQLFLERREKHPLPPPTRPHRTPAATTSHAAATRMG